MDEKTRASGNSILSGILLGAFGIGIALSGALGLNALTFVLVILVLLFILHYATPAVNVLFIVGVIFGVLIVIVLPVLSPATLDAVPLLLVLGVLALMK